MIAAYSAENQINRILTELVCAVSNYAAIAGKLSGSRVAAALAGTNDFSAEDAEYHLQVARDMQGLVAETKVPIDWRRVEEIRKILAERKQKNLIHTVFVIEFDDRSLLQEIKEGLCRRTTNSANAVPIKDRVTAIAAVDALDKMGFKCLAHPTRMRVPEEQIAKSLSDLGFAQS